MIIIYLFIYLFAYLFVFPGVITLSITYTEKLHCRRNITLKSSSSFLLGLTKQEYFVCLAFKESLFEVNH